MNNRIDNLNISIVQKGISNKFSVGANTSAYCAVKFPKSFTITPCVIVCPDADLEVADIYIAVRYITKIGFSVYAVNRRNTNVDVRVNWIAI